MIVIVGESGCGKTTLVNDYVNAHLEIKRIVTYTTRPMREGEKDGVDYHFVQLNEFNRLVNMGFFVEYASYRGWWYGTPVDSCGFDNRIAVLTPTGLRSLKRLGCEVTSVYLNVDRGTRLISLINRGDDIDEAYRRNLSDVGMFDGIEAEVDFIIENQGFFMDKKQVLSALEGVLESKK